MVEISFKWGAITVLAYGLILPLTLRIARGLTPLIVFCISALVVHAIGTGIMVVCIPGCSYWHGAALFWFCFMAYLYGFNTLYKSISIDMLFKLGQSPGSRLQHEEICKIVENQFNARARLLIENRYVTLIGNAYSPTASGRDLASRIRKAQKIFGINVSGLYSAW